MEKKSMQSNLIKILLLMVIVSSTALGQNGVYKSYYYGGKKSAEISYSDGIYDGTSIWYYENGNIKEIKTFSNGKVNGWCKTYYESGLLKEEKFVKDGYIHGILKRYYANGALEAILTYEGGKLVKSTYFDFDPYYQAPIEAYRAGNKQQVVDTKSEEFLCDVKICPLPLSGMDAVYRNLVYPPDAIAYGLEGSVRLVATVNRNGEVIDAKVISGIGLGCDEAAVEAVKKTRFLPGQNSGGPTKANVTFSVEFNLENKTSKATDKPVLPQRVDAKQSTSEPEIGVSSKVKTLDKTSDEPDQTGVEVVTVESGENKTESMIVEKPGANVNKYDLKKTVNYFSCSGYDVCAKPQGGIDDVLNNLNIPKKVKENDIKGEVVILCDVDENGKVRNTTIKKGLPHGCNVAVEVALIYTKFEPAMKNNKPVRSTVTVTVPIDY